MAQLTSSIRLCVVAVFVVLYSSNGVVSEMCRDRGEQQVCDQTCKDKGKAYGMCEYSDCVCYGRRKPSVTTYDHDDDDDDDHDDDDDDDRVDSKTSPVFCSYSRGDCSRFCGTQNAQMIFSTRKLCCCEF